MALWIDSGIGMRIVELIGRSRNVRMIELED